MGQIVRSVPIVPNVMYSKAPLELMVVKYKIKAIYKAYGLAANVLLPVIYYTVGLYQTTQ